MLYYICNSAIADLSSAIEDRKFNVAAGISHASMAKLGKNENVTTDVLVKICNALQCDIGDIMEMVPETTDRKDAE